MSVVQIHPGSPNNLLGSSIGLGHRPFTAGRGVRFPYRVPTICTGGREAQCNGLQNRKAAGSNPALCSICPCGQIGKGGSLKRSDYLPVRVRAGVPLNKDIYEDAFRTLIARVPGVL